MLPITMSSRPTGTVTFLFTDIEGSTRMWEEHRAAMPAALEQHDDRLRSELGAEEADHRATGAAMDGPAAHACMTETIQLIRAGLDS
jgi:class 3 adenylate cyclase